MSSNTFGTGSPKWIAGGTEFALDKFVRLKDEPLYNNIINQSKLTGMRSITSRPRGWLFEGYIHLYKHSVPLTSFTTLHTLYNTDGALWRHNDGEPFSTSSGGIVPFRLTQYKRFFLTNKNWEDGLFLRFEYNGTANVDITSTLKRARYLITDDGKFLVTDDGKKIKVADE